MKISIVMAYYNRRRLLLNTLVTIANSSMHDDLEIVIVDDGSSDSENVDDLNDIFPRLNIKVITVDKNKKWWINPCIAYNIGLANISGDIVIIQNPECMHVGNVVKTASLKESNDYIAFGAYSVGPSLTNKINTLVMDESLSSNVLSIITPTVDKKVELVSGYEKWYQHSTWNPSAIHFCCAISAADLKHIGGFDERFSTGIAYDDREFLVRIKRMGINVKFVDNPFVVHQCHGYTDYSNYELFKKNGDLLADVVASAHIMAPNKINYKDMEAVYEGAHYYRD